jgi:hypothetical protein
LNIIINVFKWGNWSLLFWLLHLYYEKLIEKYRIDFERSLTLSTLIRKLRVGFLKLPEVDSILLYLVWLKPHLSFAPLYRYVTGWEICRNYITGHMRVTLCHEYYNDITNTRYDIFLPIRLLIATRMFNFKL